MPKRASKVFAYITSGHRLLLFAHPDHRDAGIQVPAGTLKSGEEAIAGGLREAEEETGLTELTVAGVLGEREFDVRPYGRNEVHHRTFVHLVCDFRTPEHWDHWELDPDDAPGERFRFTLFWASLDELPNLIAGHDELLPELRIRLGVRSG